MWKHSIAMTGFMWYKKFLYGYHSVENRFFALAALDSNKTKTRLSEPKYFIKK